jgi:pimeloyl-ACP methyl ester carboxylesterase
MAKGIEEAPTVRPVAKVVPYREVELHGHRVGYRCAGDGDQLLVLLHGITSTSEAWRRLMPRLAERYTVVAPDMIGQGSSAKPRGDYSLGAYAAGVRDLLAVLGFERGTVIGHSFGGGTAMQFAYLFPEYTQRMALIASGGLGPEVHPLLRAATLPGSEWVLPLLAREWPVRAGEAIASVAGRLGIEAGPDLAEFARGYASLTEKGASEAFIHTMRSVIDPALHSSTERTSTGPRLRALSAGASPRRRPFPSPLTPRIRLPSRAAESAA